jgi:hypothetical protein
LGEMPLFKLKPFATIRPFSFKMALSCLDGWILNFLVESLLIPTWWGLFFKKALILR